MIARNSQTLHWGSSVRTAERGQAAEPLLGRLKVGFGTGQHRLCRRIAVRRAVAEDDEICGLPGFALARRRGVAQSMGPQDLLRNSSARA